MVSADGPNVTDTPEKPNKDEPAVVNRIANQASSSPVNSSSTSSSDAEGEATSKPIEGEIDAGEKSAAPATPERQKTPATKKKAAEPKPPKRKIDRAVIEFQPDAVELEERPIPGGLRWTLYIVITLIVSAVTWACLTRVDRIVVAEGKLVITNETIVIQPANGGAIRKLTKRFGDIVRAGETLAVLDGTFSDADVAKLKSGIAGFQAKVDRLTAEREDKDFTVAADSEDLARFEEFHVFRARQSEYKAKIEETEKDLLRLDAEALTNESDRLNQEAKMKILVELEGKAKALLDKGSQTETEYIQAKLRVQETNIVIENLKSRRKVIDREKDVLVEKLNSFKATWFSEINEKLLEARQAQRQMIEDLNKAIRLQDLVELKVPSDLGHEEFFVQEVADRSVGSFAEEGEPLFRLVPLDHVEMEAEVDIPTKDIGVVAVGDTVRVKLAAFPYQEHGVLQGEVRTIGEGSYQKQETNNKAEFYRARIKLTSTKLENLPHPDKFRLVPAMEASAEIKVGDRTVISYFLYPLLRQLDSSIRER